MSLLGKMRKFKEVKTPGGVRLVKRDRPVPAVALVDVGPCPLCDLPLMVAPGQQIRFHKECRKEGRKRFGRADHVVEVDLPKKVI